MGCLAATAAIAAAAATTTLRMPAANQKPTCGLLSDEIGLAVLKVNSTPAIYQLTLM